jgi:hypothetical protein
MLDVWQRHGLSQWFMSCVHVMCTAMFWAVLMCTPAPNISVYAAQEINPQWEPADLLPPRSQALAPSTAALPQAGHNTDQKSATLAAKAAAADGGEDEGCRSAPLVRHAHHFHAPAPSRDPQAGKTPPEQHVLKLLRDAQEAGECAFPFFYVAQECIPASSAIYRTLFSQVRCACGKIVATVSFCCCPFQ